jgi:elongation factor 1 alpha-like protein
MGHLLYLLGYVDAKTIHRYERDSKSIGKDSFHFAWVLDAGSEERQRGVTIDVGCSHFATPNREITILDAPGHKDFIPNMISGAAQADAAILVIDASLGEFERGFEGENQHGQTKEHSFLARSLGINHIIVAINKLDVVQWDQSRYIYIQSVLEPFLKRAGFKDPLFIPISGLQGGNLVTKNNLIGLEWYTGGTLLDLVDSIPQPQRNLKKPFRFCVMDAYKLSHGSITGEVLAGRIEGGVVKAGDRVIVRPDNITATIKNIEINGLRTDKAIAGDHADISLKELNGDFSLIVPGDVMCSIDFPIHQIKKFRAKIYTFDILFPITKGMKLIMFVQSLKITVQLIKLVEQIDGITGKVLKTNPRCFTRNMAGVIEVETDQKVCIEKFSNYKSLGRVLFRDRSETVMAGMVLELLE